MVEMSIEEAWKELERTGGGFSSGPPTSEDIKDAQEKDM